MNSMNKKLLQTLITEIGAITHELNNGVNAFNYTYLELMSLREAKQVYTNAVNRLLQEGKQEVNHGFDTME